MLVLATQVHAQQVGSIVGTVYDQEWSNPIEGARVSILETSQAAVTDERGEYRLTDVLPGRYTLVFSCSGYTRKLKPGVVVTEGRLSEHDMWLPGIYEDMGEVVVQDLLQMGGASEMALLELRFESPALMDSISSDLMSRAGASDASQAVSLVAGATVQDNKAVIRGLPDRYVSSQMNGVRLPSADEDTRAVELDQFPAVVIDSVQVTKTFTPNQQGDASGGAVDVRLKGLPDENSARWQIQYSYNDRTTGGDDFLTYDEGPRRPQYENLSGNWVGGVGVERTSAPLDYKFSGSLGGRHEIERDLTVGAFLSAYYEKDSFTIEDGIDEQRWIEEKGGALVPEKKQQTASDEFATALFRTDQSTRTTSWGTLGTLGLEAEDHAVDLTYLYTFVADDFAAVFEDTKGKKIFTKQFYGVDYDVDDPENPGNSPDGQGLAPYRRSETLEYTERTTSTLQLHGDHVLAEDGWRWGDAFDFGAPEFEWTLSHNTAEVDQPDKRLFGTQWLAPSFQPGIPIFGIPDSISQPTHAPFKPSANANLGYLQRIFKNIQEESDQLSAGVRFPFEQWDDEGGAFRLGMFHDTTQRQFDQNTFSNPQEFSTYEGEWQDLWSQQFPFENHPIQATQTDVDYDAELEINAWYAMFDLPVSESVDLVGGVRFERSQLEVNNVPEADATYFLPNGISQIDLQSPEAAGIRNFGRRESDALPSLGLIYEPVESVTLRAAYSETIARQTFKELTPIIQQEFLGGPIFIGNTELEQSAVTNYDLRADWRPEQDSLVSLSWFRKDVEDAIEYVQRGVVFAFTTPVNYPEGRLKGFELELRQGLGRFWPAVDGLSVGANATKIDSKVTVSDDEVDFLKTNAGVTILNRDMTGAPEHLYNVYALYDLAEWGTRFSLFYTVRGDTLVAGAGSNNANFVPSIYEAEVGTLNFSVSQKFGKDDQWDLTFKAKNLTDPDIDQVYRSRLVASDVIRTSFKRGREFSVSLSGRF